MQRWLMALYEYYCKNCEDVVDISHPINDSPQIICMQCYSTRVKKLGVGAVTFKGSGWGKDR